MNKENFKMDETNMLNETQNFKTGTIGYDFKKESANEYGEFGLIVGYGKNTADLMGRCRRNSTSNLRLHRSITV